MPMTPDLAARLIGWSKSRGLVFGQPNGQPLTSELARAALKRISKRASLRNLGWHVLRHTYATQLVSAGVSIRTVQELPGHADIKMTMRYAHVAPAALHEAILVLPKLNGLKPVQEEFGQPAVNRPAESSLPTPHATQTETRIFAELPTKTRLREETRSW